MYLAIRLFTSLLLSVYASQKQKAHYNAPLCLFLAIPLFIEKY